jgi:hypothetical protein
MKLKLNFNKSQKNNMQNVEDGMRDLENCGDKYCGKIITSQQMKDEGHLFLQKVLKDCRSTTQPANEQEYKLQREKYNKCFTKHKKRSKYNKRLTKRKKCEDKYCSVYQKKVQNAFSSIKKK